MNCGKGRKAILVVDDDEDIRETILEVLALAGHVGFGAADGTGALALLHQRQFDLILTDLQMPGMDGWQLLSALRADAVLSNATAITSRFTSRRIIAASKASNAFQSELLGQGATARKDVKVTVAVALNTSRMPQRPAASVASVAVTIHEVGSGDAAGQALAISDEPTARTRIV